MRERESGTGLEGERSRELLGVDSQCWPFASKIHLPRLQETLLGLGMGGSGWVNQFIAGFPLIGTVGEEGVYPLKDDPPRPQSTNSFRELRKGAKQTRV